MDAHQIRTAIKRDIPDMPKFAHANAYALIMAANMAVRLIDSMTNAQAEKVLDAEAFAAFKSLKRYLIAPVALFSYPPGWKP